MIPVLSPAYGRDYKSKRAVKEALDADKDFIIHTTVGRSTYINKPQLVELGYAKVQIRYGKMRKVAIITL